MNFPSDWHDLVLDKVSFSEGKRLMGVELKDMGGEEFEIEYRKVWRNFALKEKGKELVARELRKKQN